ncbi:MAG TPA: hypothetical protein DFR83_11810 [Deltaproteobacteria bacterium]|nr:hypothetical protein [Deltaproteobacteria bacterium]
MATTQASARTEELYTRFGHDPLSRELIPILTSETGTSSSGYPFLLPPVWRRLRDWVPHILSAGPRVLATVERLVDAGASASAGRVVRQVVRSAAVTAPPDLWLTRHIVDALRTVGVLDRLAAGETVAPADNPQLRAEELAIDLRFLLSRGWLVRAGAGYRLAAHAHARQLPLLGPIPLPAGVSMLWQRALEGETIPELDALDPALIPLPQDRHPGLWSATAYEVELGYRLVPLVVALRAHSERMDRTHLPPVGHRILDAAGAGERVLDRGPGPFGIIEAYHPYMAALPTVLRSGRGAVHVDRATNIAASQAANRKSFRRANDALDRFCADTGFSYRVFIEHALGRGEAVQQRHARGPAGLQFVGADLEDAAIDAAMQSPGMPPNMVFVRSADIGRPETLFAGMGDIPTEGAVLMVGNGFHEVRDQSDDGMVAVFAEYARAGLLLMFTEESALSIDALIETAWNTYHAGFKYVHERSGQGLRPATPGLPSALDGPLPASWVECATRAGYVYMDPYCARSRTIYPTTPPSGHNPSISVTHFFVPLRISEALGVTGTA